MNNIAIITARGGSKRIPRKNIKNFCGKPVIAYSIEAAINSNLFSEIMVSTDDKEIAEIAKSYGAKVPFLRSKKTSNDFATTRDVLLEVLDNYKKMNKEFEYLCCIYPVAPFVTSEKLQDSYDLMIKENAQNLVPMVKFSVPPQTGFYIRKNKIEKVFSCKLPNRTQDIEPIYFDPGQFYWHKIDYYLENETLEGSLPYIISELEAQDIDNISDWKIAEMKYSLIKK